jgi:D-alanyl-D-alanine carboxypeptidase
MKSQSKQTLIFALIVFSAVGAGYFWPKFKAPPLAPSASVPNYFAEILIGAKTAFVYDLADEKMLYGLHEDKSMPVASLAKIMTAIAALDVFDPDEIISIPGRALAAEGDNGLLQGEKWRVAELIQFMLIVSSNDAAEALAIAAEAKIGAGGLLIKMNEKARALGLQKTEFKTASGIEDIDDPGAVSTAREIARLVYFAHENYPEIFAATALPEAEFVSRSGFSHKIKNTNPYVNSETLVSKTGFTSRAGGSLAVLFGDRPIVVVVLGGTQEGRFTDVERLLTAAILTTNAVAE